MSIYWYCHLYFSFNILLPGLFLLGLILFMLPLERLHLEKGKITQLRQKYYSINLAAAHFNQAWYFIDLVRDNKFVIYDKDDSSASRLKILFKDFNLMVWWQLIHGQWWTILMPTSDTPRDFLMQRTGPRYTSKTRFVNCWWKSSFRT